MLGLGLLLAILIACEEAERPQDERAVVHTPLATVAATAPDTPIPTFTPTPTMTPTATPIPTEVPAPIIRHESNVPNYMPVPTLGPVVKECMGEHSVLPSDGSNSGSFPVWSVWCDEVKIERHTGVMLFRFRLILDTSLLEEDATLTVTARDTAMKFDDWGFIVERPPRVFPVEAGSEPPTFSHVWTYGVLEGGWARKVVHPIELTYKGKTQEIKLEYDDGFHGYSSIELGRICERVLACAHVKDRFVALLYISEPIDLLPEGRA